MTAKPLRILLEGLIDYAGLFPPAALSMQDAVRNYARYREGGDAWALGRFVVPLERVVEVPDEFPLSVLWNGLAAPPVAESATLESKAGSEEDVERLAANAGGRIVFVEITDLRLLDAIQRVGLRAKIRTGGVTADAFPSITDVAAFIRACVARGVAFKATAGLHHPLRCVRPLTYEPQSPTGTMHGFFNVFLAAVLPGQADAILAEDDRAAFSVEPDAIVWRGQRITADAIASMRSSVGISFGSCSFEEPMDDLRQMEWV